MVKQVEASKCQQVVHINSSLGSVLLVCTLADRRLLDVYTLTWTRLCCAAAGPEPVPVHEAELTYRTV